MQEKCKSLKQIFHRIGIHRFTTYELPSFKEDTRNRHTVSFTTFKIIKSIRPSFAILPII
jgi:hypothetical protein